MSILRWVAMGLCVLCALVGLYLVDVANQRMVMERERERGVMEQRERDLSMYGSTQEGWVIPLGSPDDEEGWLSRAQTIADQRKEAIAVVQEGVLIALINPSNSSTNGHKISK